jgi:hypothetical protein
VRCQEETFRGGTNGLFRQAVVSLLLRLHVETDYISYDLYTLPVIKTRITPPILKQILNIKVNPITRRYAWEDPQD